MSMKTSITTLASVALLAAMAAGAHGELARSLVLTPGKGVSFYMGSKHGITLFTPDNGACALTVTIAENPDQEGMASATASRVKMAVVPGRPARVETAEGQALVFACNPDAQSMKLDMPPDFKYTPKG
jgi:ABC-type sugar transport system substrate-binding protein